MQQYTERNGLHYSISVSHDSRRKSYYVAVHPARPTDRNTYEIEIFAGKYAHLNAAPRKSAKAQAQAEEAAKAILPELMDAVDKERTLK